jgi:hypothetical protein
MAFPLTVKGIYRTNSISQVPDNRLPKTVRLTTKGDGGRLIYSLEKFDMNEVTDFIAKIHDKTKELEKLRDEIRAALATAPPKSQPATPSEE